MRGRCWRRVELRFWPHRAQSARCSLGKRATCHNPHQLRAISQGTALALTATAATAAAAPSGSFSAPSGSSSAISAASIFSGWRLLDSCLQRWQSDVFVAWKLRTCNLLHHKPLLFDGFIGASYTLSLQQQHYMDYFCNELNKLLTRIQWCTLHQRYFGAARHPTA